MKYQSHIAINGRRIDLESPTYFIADIAANHDGDLARAKDLIRLARECGADAVKFQHFKAEKIVSDYGFRNLGEQLGHQAKWKKSIFEVYQDAECRRDWTLELVETAKAARVDFFTTPYDYEALDLMNPHVPAYKIGSGDLTWTDFIIEIARLKKPTILATGASTMEEVERAVAAILEHNPEFALMQCNTNYTGSMENFHYINLLVLRKYAQMWPGMVMGLSDHTPGHATVLGAVALGARIIEKHFTDDNDRNGPDHPFSMNPKSWREMVDQTRRLEANPVSIEELAAQNAEIQMALGDGVKRVEENEAQTVVLQRRCLRMATSKKAGEVLTAADLVALRPCPSEALPPYEMDKAVGRKLTSDKESGQELYRKDVLEPACY